MHLFILVSHLFDDYNTDPKNKSISCVRFEFRSKMDLLILIAAAAVIVVGSPNVIVNDATKKHQFEMFNKDCVKNDEHVKHNSSQIMHS